MAKRPEVFIVSGPYAGRSFDVKEGGVRLGRSSSNDVQIPDEELSRNHCLFEPSGEAGLRLTDLASANGTFLNGALVGNEPVELKEGDSIEVGKTLLRVGDKFESDPTVCVGRVDLGLDASSSEASAADANGAARAPRSRLFNLLLGAAAVAVAGAAAVFLLAPGSEPVPAPVPLAAETTPVLREFAYESVKADLAGIFRYELTLSGDGVLSLTVDDVPGENRHLRKNEKLSEDALREFAETLDFKAVKDLDREYVGPDPEPAALESRALRVVYTTRARTVRVVNTTEPAAFKAVRERLETQAKNVFGIWAIQYPREKLVELATRSVEVGDAKWSDRDVEYGNLWAAILAYREASFYLETVNPKPPCQAAAQEGLARATAELATRAKDQRFAADRAMNLRRWDEACRALKVLLEMVPDRSDDRNRDAREKLVSAERELKKGDK